MKKTIALFLCLIVLLPGMTKVLYISYWNINRDTIEKLFCKNIDKPEMECHGQCHLEETLSKIDNSEEKDKSAPLWEKLAENLIFTEELISYEFTKTLNEIHLSNPSTYYYSENYLFTQFKPFFHPPCFV
jgi:hypothetical protein